MIDNVQVLIIDGHVGGDTLTLAELFGQSCPRARVWTAGGADQALEYLLAHGEFAGRDDRTQPDLLVLEGTAPLDEVLALLSLIRVLPSTSAVPVVIVTRHPDNEFLGLCYAAGANSVVADTGDAARMAGVMGTLHAFWTEVNETL